MNPRALVISLWLLGLVAVRADAPPFQMRLVSREPTNDTEDMSYVELEAPKQTQILHVRKAALLDQSYVQEAYAGLQPSPTITIVFNVPGSEKFAAATRDNVGERLAIVIDGKVISAPVIREKIVGGVAQITGTFTLKEAQGLAAKIMASIKKP